MNFQFYLEKLLSSEVFEKFMKENPSAFLCSGFFAIDKKSNNNQQHFDYFNPELNKMFSFKFDNGKIDLIPVENFEDNFIPRKISDNYDFDFGEIGKMIEDRMNEEKIDKKIEKILLSLQNKGGRDFLIGTVFISGLGMIKVLIDLNEKKIVEFEKKSFFDILRVKKKKD